MDHFAKLIAALVLSFAGTAHAGYAQLAPPTGFGGSPGNWTFAPAANDARYGNVAVQPNGLRVPVPGSAATMPAAYRFAANAPKIAAQALFLHPGIRTAAGIALWLGIASVVYDPLVNTWYKLIEDIDLRCGDGGQMYINALNSYRGTGPYGIPHVVSGRIVFENGACKIYVTQTAEQWEGPPRTTEIFAGQFAPVADDIISKKPLTKEEFEKELVPEIITPGAPSIMPDTVPWELPYPTHLPIYLPYINPEPGTNPQHRPFFVPTGDPVPNPNYDPNAAPGPNNQPYIQPGTRVVPSPTPSQPWRVDIQPVNRPQADGIPKPNPDAEPGTDPADKPKPEEQQSLCEKHPDIVACAKLGEPGQATPVPNETKTLTIAPENGFGPSGGSCPPPRTVQVAGLTLSMPFDLLCDFATGLKPVIVGLAWLTAAFTFMGIGRRS